jgi:hypothetical protein
MITRITIIAALLGLLAVSGIVVFAGDEDDSASEKRARVDAIPTVPGVEVDGDTDGGQKRLRVRVRRSDDAPQDDQARVVEAPVDGDEASLGNSVQIEFTIIGEETRAFFVHSAGGEFLIKHDVSQPNHEHALEITGQARPTDNPERISLTFEAKMHHADLNDGFDATFRAEGSAVLTLGKKTMLATLGDKPLMVTATVEEELPE